METAVPVVVDHVLAVVRAVPVVIAGDVLVLDGPPLRELPQTAVVAIGWPGRNVDDTSSGSSTREWLYAGGNTQREDVRVACWLSVWRGGTDMAARRAEAVALLEGIAAALRASPATWTAAGQLQYCRVDDVQLEQTQSDTGAEVTIAWSVVARCQF